MHKLFWAKSSHTGERHPLICHLMDAGNVASALWHQCFSSALKVDMANRLDVSVDAAHNWVCFFVSLHDIGKAIPCFQMKIQDAREKLEVAGFDFLKHQNQIPHGNATVVIAQNYLTQCLHFETPFASVVSRAIGGHHGVFPESRQINPVERDVRLLGCNRVWHESRMAILNILSDAFDIRNHEKIRPRHPFDDPAFLMLLAGITSVADWIASMEIYFPYTTSNQDSNAYMALSRTRAAAALDTLGWTRWNGDDQIISFENLFSLTPRPLQSTVIEMEADMGDAVSNPGLVIIECPMGEGKTEAAMYLSDAWTSKRGRSGCYFALPTQAAGNQMYTRVRGFLSSRYEQSVLHLLHGKAFLSDEYRGSRDSKIAISDDSGHETVSVEEWFLKPKRGLLAPFAVGTIDQALLAALQTRHHFVRLFGLAQKTVIFDEVHAYDTYMSELLDRLLEWLGALRVPVVLLSATLPAKRRNSLIGAYAGREMNDDKQPYPRITWVRHSNDNEQPVLNVRHVEASHSTRRTIQLDRIEHSPQAISTQLQDLLSEGGCAVVICNSVARAQEIYETLRESGLRPDAHELMLLHARFPFDDREKLENKVVNLFGKKAFGNKRPKRAVLVATQIVEQSLDLDFDVMVTDPAPVDLLLQRAGRLHRHTITRPPGLVTPTLIMTRPPVDEDDIPDFSEVAGVYDEYILLKTHLCLDSRTHICLPDDMENLIEAVYGEENGDRIHGEEWKMRLAHADQKMKQKHLEMTHKAGINLIHPPKRGAELLIEQNNRELNEDEDPKTANVLRAMTRLAGPSVSVICLHQVSETLSLDVDGADTVFLDASPDFDTALRLLRRSVSITSMKVVPHLIKTGNTPNAWARHPLLRHHRILVFENGIATVGKFTLRLDSELGIVFV